LLILFFVVILHYGVIIMTPLSWRFWFCCSNLFELYVYY